MRTRLALTTLAAALLAVPTGASAARGVTVKIPKSITAYKSFPLEVEGDTGPGELATGGFIVETRIIKGKGACLAEPDRRRFGASGGSENVWAPGPFRTATQTYVSKPGSYRICSYLTQNNTGIAYDLVYTKTFKAKALPRRAKLQLDQKKPKDGTYTANASQILGGVPTSSLTFTVTGGKVVSAAAAGIPNTSCFTDFPTQTPIVDNFTTNTPSNTYNDVIGISFGASFVGAPPSGQIRITASATSSKEFQGQVAINSADDSCRGGFAFTARR